MNDLCRACRKDELHREILPEWVEDLGGVTVMLRNAVIRETCNSCGESTTEIPDLDGLAKAAAVARALAPARLRGAEVRFIRRAFDMTGREFAEAMEVTPETLSRWENGVRGVGGYTEKLLRHNVCALLHGDLPVMDFDPIWIAKLRIEDVAEDYEFPPIAFVRVVAKINHRHQEGWDLRAA